MKALYMIISIALGNKFQSLCKMAIVLLTLTNALLGLSSNVNLKYNMTPKCF